MFPIPPSQQRLADQIDGWLDLRCPDKVLELLDPLLAGSARAAGLAFRVRALCRLGRYTDALIDLAELRKAHPDDDWIALTDAWCRKRTGDFAGAVRVLQALIARDGTHAVARFNLACYLTRIGDKDAAIAQLALACSLDAECRAFARDEPDFDPLRTDSRFRELMRQGGGGDGFDDEDDDDLDDEDDDLDAGEDREPDSPDRRRN